MIEDIEFAISEAKFAKLNLFEFLQNINSTFEELTSISSSMLRLNHFCHNFDKIYPHKSLISDALSTIEITEDIDLLIKLFDLMELIDNNCNYSVDKKDLCNFIFNHKDFSHKSFYRQKKYLLSIGYNNLNFELIQNYAKSSLFNEDFFKDFIKNIIGNDNPLKDFEHPLKNKIINDLTDYCFQEDNSYLSNSITVFLLKNSKSLNKLINEEDKNLKTKELILLIELLRDDDYKINNLISILIKRKDLSNYFDYLKNRNTTNKFSIVSNVLVSKILGYLSYSNSEMYEFEDYYKNIYYNLFPKRKSHPDYHFIYEKMLKNLFQVKDNNFIIKVVCELESKSLLEKALNNVNFSKKELITLIDLLEKKDDFKQIVMLKLDPELSVFI